jgi:branched-chain amino acid transport system permease protein
MDWNFFFVIALNGVIYGSFLLLPTLGLSLVFGLGRVVNFAHGQLYALGAYLAVDLMRKLGGYWPAVIISPLVMVLFAVVVERLTIEPIRNRSDIYTLLVTFGLGLMIVGGIEQYWGTAAILVPLPRQFQGTVTILGNEYPSYRLVAAALSLIITAGAFAVVQWTPVGLRIRAVADDAEMAGAIGINTRWLMTIVFGGAAGLAAFAGALGAPIFTVNLGMGSSILLDSFLAVILGGLGNLQGSAIGAFIVALAKNIGGGYFSDWSIAVIFGVVGLMLIIRPKGVLGRGRVA